MPGTEIDPQTAQRVEDLLAEMTVAERVAQLGSAWVENATIAGNVAPMQDVFGSRSATLGEQIGQGLGHLTRIFGTKPTTVDAGVTRLRNLRHEVIDKTRLHVPAIVHEECLTGFTTLGATVYPAPLAQAATFDPALVERMAAAIGADMAAVGVHQGLSPVLDVVRDYRWGRVEETYGEDPFVVAVLGTAYVVGLQSAGVIATLKHFAGYSASRAARNHAPVSMGPREFRDVMLVPFEYAVRIGNARSVMNSYTDVDGQPVAADAALLTGVLRDEWGFTGTVVSDYWAIAFLKNMHRAAHDHTEAGVKALLAGIDVELPDTLCFGDGLVLAIEAGEISEEYLNRAARRVLTQKAELGLLEPHELVVDATRDLDSPHNRAIASEIAAKSVVLLTNRQTLPLPATSGQRIAVVGPCADDASAFLGCYSYPNHVLPSYPELGLGLPASSFLASLRDELPGHDISYARGCGINDDDLSGVAAAQELAGESDLCIVVVGDKPGLFGLGTSGEGCDRADLALPGVQGALVESLLATETPVILISASGRPYALGPYVSRAAAIVQAFLPGIEGGPALAGVLSGRIAPSGRLPVQIPQEPGGQPGTYLQPPLGLHSEGVSNLDPTPAFAFGHGLTYTEFAYGELHIDRSDIDSHGEVVATATVTNTGNVAGDEVVQLYLRDVVAQIARPALQLIGFARVALKPGASAHISFTIHAERTAFTGSDLRRLIEPGEFELHIGRSAADITSTATFQVTGQARVLTGPRVLTTPTSVATAHVAAGEVGPGIASSDSPAD